MMTYKVGNYLPSDSMGELICENYPMLLVVSRFGIELGFGEDSIAEVCKKNGVDTDTFLAVVNILISDEKLDFNIDYKKISLLEIISYLKRSHSYFLDYRLPVIRRELSDSLKGDDTVSIVILKYYDDYIKEVNRHMMYEENTLFPYIYSMIEGHDTSKYSIDVYSKHHDKVEAKLSELKNIMIKYYPAKSTNELNNALYDIFSCERDLAAHNNIEDHLLVPTMREFEQSNNREHV